MGQLRPYHKGADPQRAPIFEFVSIYEYTFSRRTTSFDVVTYGERACFYGVSHAPAARGGATALPNFGCSLPLGQPRHCTCTNASRGLSATAEFVVFTITVFSNAFDNQLSGLLAFL